MRIFIIILICIIPKLAFSNIPSWDIIKDKSSLSFQTKQMGKEISGQVNDFDGLILFDVNNLEQSKIDIKINLNSIDSKGKKRDAKLQEKEWFDIVHYPEARFKSVKIKKLDNGLFEIDGELTIKDVTNRIKLPFELQFYNEQGYERALAIAEIELNRMSFNLGTGDWSDSSIISHDFSIYLKLYAKIK